MRFDTLYVYAELQFVGINRIKLILYLIAAGMQTLKSFSEIVDGNGSFKMI